MLPNIIKIYAKSDFMIQWQLADGYDGQEFKFTLFTNEEIENGWVASYIDGHYTNCTVEDDKVNIYVDSTHTIKAGCLTIQSEYDYNNTHFADNVETIKDSVKTNIYLVMNGANATSASFVPSNLPDLSGTNDYVTFSDLAAASYITAADVEQMGYVTASDVEQMGYATESYVAEYVATHTADIDMSSYVTKTELNAAGYATRTQLMFKQDVLVSGNNIKTINNQSILGSGNLKVSVDMTGYATQSYVAEYVATYAPVPDLSAYVTHTELSNAGYITSIPSEYITETELNGMGYATTTYVAEYVNTYAPIPDLSAYVTHTELSNAGYTTNSEVQNILSNGGYVTSNELSNAGYITNNDLQQTLSNAGYLTSIPSEYITETELNGMGYATEAYVQNKIESIPSVDLSSYVTYNFLSSQSYLQSIPSEYITETELSGMGYATEAYVQNKIESIPSVDLSSYVTYNFLSSQSYLQSIPSEYITETELNGMGYATEAYVQNKIESIPSVDLSSYVTHTELSNAGYITYIPSEYITETELSGMGYATTTYVAEYVNTYAPTPDMSAYVTHTELSNAGYAQVVEILTADYELLSYEEKHNGDIYVLTDAYYTVDVVTTSYLETYYASQSYVAEYVNTYAPTPDMSAYVTHTELSNASYVTNTQLQQAGYITSIPSDYITETELSAMGYITASYVEGMGFSNTYTLTQSEYDALIESGTYDPTTIYIISDAAPVDLSYYVLTSYLETYYYPKTYVDAYYVSKAYLSSCGYLTQDNFEYDSVNNTLTIRI